MSSIDYDLFVIGAGSGGVRCARVAASLGARVAIAEEHRAGGTCVIRGCVPKKLLTYAAHYREDFADAAGYGWSVPRAEFSWPTLIANKNHEIARLEGIYRNLLARSGVTTMDGRATVIDAHTVAIDGKRHTCRHLVIATGGWPMRPALPGAEHCITSNEAFELPALPRRVLVIGAGYIGLEFAGIFHGLGAEVAVVYRGDEILRGFDPDVRRHLHSELAKKGIRIDVHTDLLAVERRSDGTLVATLHAPAGNRTHEADAIMLATGRRPNTRGIGLEAIGVATDDHGAVQVDRYSRTSVEGVYAIGDVTNRVALTPVAIREGQALAHTLFGRQPVPVDHRDVPHAVFSSPPVCVVGASEEDALAEHDVIEVYKTSFRPLRHTLTGRDERTFMKLVVDQRTQRVLGAHMVGADAPEIIQGIAIAVKMRLTKSELDSTVAIHPTAAEEFVTLRDPVVVARA